MVIVLALRGGKFLAHALLPSIRLQNEAFLKARVQFGFIRFNQLTLPEAVSILCPGVPGNARVVHKEMISLFSCSGLFASVHFERLQLRK